MKKIFLILLICIPFLAPKTVKKKKFVPKNPEYLIGEWEVFQVRELTCNCNDEVTPEKTFGFIVKFPGTLLGRKLNIGNYNTVFHLEKVQNINKMYSDFKCANYSKEPEEVRIGKGNYSTVGKFIDRLNKGNYPNTESISNEAVYGRKFREIVKIGQPFKIFDIVQNPDGKGEYCDSPHNVIAVFRKTVMAMAVGNTIVFLQRLHPDKVGIRKKALEDPFKKKPELLEEKEEDEKSEEEIPDSKRAGVESSNSLPKNNSSNKNSNLPPKKEKVEEPAKKDPKYQWNDSYDDEEDDDEDDF